jgi:CheY-like chemotaxis protein
MDKNALILIVDDNAEYRALLVWTLELYGFQTISATCGLEAVELAIERQPGLVLMDLNMPGMNGYEATRAIHAHRHGRKIPVVAVSADRVGYGYESSAFEKGFIACVRKPWEQEALIKIVTKVLTSGVKAHPWFQLKST